MREYRLVRDFNFITLYEVSQSVLLRCTQTDIFVNNRNKFSPASLLLLLRCYECMLGSYLVHDHV